MQDMTDRLARLNDSPAADTVPGDDIVAGDLRRGRTALRRRRARNAGLGTAGVAGIAAVAAVVSLNVGGASGPAAPQAAAPDAAVSTAPKAAASAAVPRKAVAPEATGRHAPARAVELVAYTGTQRHGFDVQQVPAGYVLQGVTGSTLDIAAASDHSSLDSFAGKLTVGIESVDETGGLEGYDGRAVTVGGQPGKIATEDGITQLEYLQGGGSGNLVTVQSWSNIALTQDQVLDFAAGITVTPDAERQHG